MEGGLLSRTGPVLWDDTFRGRYDSSDIDTAWISGASATDEAGAGYRDFYFFGHGLRYKTALMDYALVGGAPELMPASAHGVWWSRYHNYTQEEFTSQVSMDGGVAHTPLSVFH